MNLVWCVNQNFFVHIRIYINVILKTGFIIEIFFVLFFMQHIYLFMSAFVDSISLSLFCFNTFMILSYTVWLAHNLLTKVLQAFVSNFPCYNQRGDYHFIHGFYSRIAGVCQSVQKSDRYFCNAYPVCDPTSNE